jgi:hypothetical protein
VNYLFAQGGPQLGELEAGLVAQAAGVTLTIASGGLLCIAATAWIAWTTPQLRGHARSPAPVPATR